ncbi:MAG: stage V sporulation protein T, partial [Lachnospiraceae bacterium]|nr:stage V sporulation protein T [Lachnospiraceae bacterium]
QVICPIICEGDIMGSVVFLERGDKKKVSETEQKIASCAANFLGRQMEQ